MILNTRNVLFPNIRTRGERDKNTLAIRERKILRKTFGPVKQNGVRSVHNNQELIDLYTEPDITSETAKRKITMVRTYGKNALRKNCESV
jgi:hypothetical protein